MIEDNIKSKMDKFYPTASQLALSGPYLQAAGRKHSIHNSSNDSSSRILFII